MTTTLRFAGAAALCAALLLGACAKKSTDQTTTTSTDTTASTTAPASDAMTPVPEVSPGAGATAGAMAASGATSAPDASATSGATMAAMSGSAGGNDANAFITLPVYPGATTSADGGTISSSSSTGSFEAKIYTTNDDAKKVVDWYKANLPSTFQNFVISSNGKTSGAFTDEHKDNSGDQSVMITSDGSATGTRIQLATKHGK